MAPAGPYTRLHTARRSPNQTLDLVVVVTRTELVRRPRTYPLGHLPVPSGGFADVKRWALYASKEVPRLPTAQLVCQAQGMYTPEQSEIAISVPAEDAQALQELLPSLQSTEIIIGRALDGTTVATLVTSIYVASIPLLDTWMKSRLERGKGCTVSFDGRKFTGYNAKDVARLMKAVNKSVKR